MSHNLLYFKNNSNLTFHILGFRVVTFHVLSCGDKMGCAMIVWGCSIQNLANNTLLLKASYIIVLCMVHNHQDGFHLIKETIFIWIRLIVFLYILFFWYCTYFTYYYLFFHLLRLASYILSCWYKSSSKTPTWWLSGFNSQWGQVHRWTPLLDLDST